MKEKYSSPEICYSILEKTDVLLESSGNNPANPPAQVNKIERENRYFAFSVFDLSSFL